MITINNKWYKIPTTSANNNNNDNNKAVRDYMKKSIKNSLSLVLNQS